MKKTVLVIGNSWASFHFLNNIDEGKYKVKIISKTNQFVYTPYLPKLLIKDLNIRQTLANTVVDNIIDVNFKTKTVYSKEKEYNYDYIVFAIGGETNTFNIPGIEHCYYVKTIDDAKVLKKKLIENQNVSVIGLGPTGSEIVGYLLDQNRHKISAIDALERPLTTFNSNLMKKVTELWKKNGVDLILNSKLIKVDKDYLYFKDFKKRYDIAIFNGGIKNNELTSKIIDSLHLKPPHYGIPVNNFLSFKKESFAIGDCNYIQNVPKTAQVASQEGKWLATYFNNDFKGKPFNYKNRGQICYVGKGISIFQTKSDKIYFYGSLTKYLNDIIHIYNAINITQKFAFLKDKID